MPKVGHFAQSSRIRQLKDGRVRLHRFGNHILMAQFDDFVLTRFWLTTKRQLPAATQESNLRWLVELLPALRQNKGDLHQSVYQALPPIASRAPWQFYQQVVAGWPKVQQFLLRELKAVPVDHRLRAYHQLPVNQLSALVSQILANQLANLMSLSVPAKLRPNHQTLVQQLQAGILTGGQIQWDAVRSLMAPYPFSFDGQDLDQATVNWLKSLAAS